MPATILTGLRKDNLVFNKLKAIFTNTNRAAHPNGQASTALLKSAAKPEVLFPPTPWDNVSGPLELTLFRKTVFDKSDDPNLFPQYMNLDFRSPYDHSKKIEVGESRVKYVDGNIFAHQKLDLSLIHRVGHNNDFLVQVSDNPLFVRKMGPDVSGRRHGHPLVEHRGENGASYFVYEQGHHDQEIKSAWYDVHFVHHDRFGRLNQREVFFWDRDANDPVKYEITNRPATIKRKDGSEHELPIIKVGRSTDPDCLIVIFSSYQNAMSPQYFALLRLNHTAMTAQWDWLDEHGMPAHLARDEYPLDSDFDSDHPTFPYMPDITWDGQQITTFTWGISRNVHKFGFHCKLLLRATPDGRRTEVVYQPKELCLPSFCTNPRFAIMTPEQRSKGKQHIFDFSTKKPIEDINIPRGYATYTMFDIVDDAVFLRKETAEQVLVAVFKLSSAVDA